MSGNTKSAGKRNQYESPQRESDYMNDSSKNTDRKLSFGIKDAAYEQSPNLEIPTFRGQSKELVKVSNFEEPETPDLKYANLGVRTSMQNSSAKRNKKPYGDFNEVKLNVNDEKDSPFKIKDDIEDGYMNRMNYRKSNKKTKRDDQVFFLYEDQNTLGTLNTEEGDSPIKMDFRNNRQYYPEEFVEIETKLRERGSPQSNLVLESERSEKLETLPEELSEFDNTSAYNINDFSKQPFIVVSMNNEITNFSNNTEFDSSKVRVEKQNADKFFVSKAKDHIDLNENNLQRIGPLTAEKSKSPGKRSEDDEMSFSWQKNKSGDKFTEKLLPKDDRQYSPNKMDYVPKVEKVYQENDMEFEAYDNIDHFSFVTGKIIDKIKTAVAQNNINDFRTNLEQSVNTYEASHQKLLETNHNQIQINKTICQKNKDLKKTLATMDSEISALDKTNNSNYDQLKNYKDLSSKAQSGKSEQEKMELGYELDEKKRLLSKLQAEEKDRKKLLKNKKDFNKRLQDMSIKIQSDHSKNNNQLRKIVNRIGTEKSLDDLLHTFGQDPYTQYSNMTKSFNNRSKSKTKADKVQNQKMRFSKSPKPVEKNPLNNMYKLENDPKKIELSKIEENVQSKKEWLKYLDDECQTLGIKPQSQEKNLYQDSHDNSNKFKQDSRTVVNDMLKRNLYDKGNLDGKFNDVKDKTYHSNDLNDEKNEKSESDNFILVKEDDELQSPGKAIRTQTHLLNNPYLGHSENYLRNEIVSKINKL